MVLFSLSLSLSLPSFLSRGPFGVVCLPPSFLFSARAVASSTTSRSCCWRGEAIGLVCFGGEKKEEARSLKEKKERLKSDFKTFRCCFFSFSFSFLLPSSPSSLLPPLLQRLYNHLRHPLPRHGPFQDAPAGVPAADEEVVRV